jgi:hypothetical protein
VVEASTEPEKVEPVLAQNGQGEQDDKIAPPCLDLDVPSHKKMLTFTSVLVFDMIPVGLPKPALTMNQPNVLGKKKIS